MPTCALGVPSVGPCVAGACPLGFECANNGLICCPLPTCPTGESSVFDPINNSHTCLLFPVAWHTIDLSTINPTLHPHHPRSGHPSVVRCPLDGQPCGPNNVGMCVGGLCCPPPSCPMSGAPPIAMCGHTGGVCPIANECINGQICCAMPVCFNGVYTFECNQHECVAQPSIHPCLHLLCECQQCSNTRSSTCRCAGHIALSGRRTTVRRERVVSRRPVLSDAQLSVGHAGRRSVCRRLVSGRQRMRQRHDLLHTPTLSTRRHGHCTMQWRRLSLCTRPNVSS
jgi:hypothetical protein